VTHGEIDALSPLIARRKLEVLPEFTSSAHFTQLATAFKRVRNIARELPGDAHEVDRSATLEEPAESALLDELAKRGHVIRQAIADGDFRRAFGEAAKFGPAVDRFFADVFVMVEDSEVRLARLQLMHRLESLILSLADISEIVAESQA